MWLRMSTAQSTSQATAQTTAPATTTAAPATATSNSATQDAAGLSQEVPPTTTEGGISGALSALGGLSSVVLDALPTDMAFQTACDNFSLAAVSQWLLVQPLTDLLTCNEDLVRRVLSTIFPEGWFVELTGDAVGLLGFALEGSSAAQTGGKLSFTGEGLSVEAHGALSVGAGVEMPVSASMTGADDQRAGFWAEMGAEAGVMVSAAWNIDFLSAYQGAASAGLSALSQTASAYDLIAPAFEIVSWQIPDTLMVTVSGEGEATAGVTGAMGEDFPESPNSTLFPTGISDWFRTGLSGSITGGISLTTGIDSDEAVISVKAELAAEGGAQVAGAGAAGNAGAELTLTARGALPGPELLTDAGAWISSLNSVEMESGVTVGDDRSAETRVFTNVMDALAALASGAGDADVTIGDLVLSREHALTDASNIQHLLPFEVADLSASSNAMIVAADVSGSTLVEIEVPEDMLRVTGLLTDIDNEEDARDVQRGVAQQMLGEVAEDGSFDLESPPALIRKAEVTVKLEAEAYAEGSLGGVGGGGGGLSGAVGKTVDLVDYIMLPVPEIQQLLTA